MEQQNNSTSECSKSKKSRFPPRVCLRKGCGRVFTPKMAKHCCCGDMECRKEIHRWQARRRQRSRRRNPNVQKAEAAAAKIRRQLDKAANKMPRKRSPARKRSVETPKPQSAGRASLRQSTILTPICGRVGCFELPLPDCRCQAIYCGAECRSAMQRAYDRQRKWLERKTFKHRKNRQTIVTSNCIGLSQSAPPQINVSAAPLTARTPGSVQAVVSPLVPRVVCRAQTEEVSYGIKDSEATVEPITRPPPT